MRVTASDTKVGHTTGRSQSGDNRRNGPVIAPRWTACPEGKESHASPDRGIPCRRRFTTDLLGRLRRTKALKKCGKAPAITRLPSIRSASRLSGPARPHRVPIQTAAPTARRALSSARRVMSFSTRCVAGAAECAHTRAIARSALIGGRSMGPYRDMRCCLNNPSYLQTTGKRSPGSATFAFAGPCSESEKRERERLGDRSGHPKHHIALGSRPLLAANATVLAMLAGQRHGGKSALRTKAAPGPQK
jgi:hypothetical protein